MKTYLTIFCGYIQVKLDCTECNSTIFVHNLFNILTAFLFVDLYQKRPAQEAVEQESAFAALRKRLASARSVADVLNRNDPFFYNPK